MISPASQGALANPRPLRGISSMATKAILAQLGAAYTQATGQAIAIESVGGVDAAKRVAAGEVFDLILLASDAVDKLVHSGHAASLRIDWVRSPVAVAVKQGSAVPDISTEAALKAAVIAAPSISYSSGPSGNYLQQLFVRWGVADEVAAKLTTPPPGTPVAQLLASGHVALGFQQLSELLNVDQVQVIGQLPEAVAFVTTFSAALSTQIDASRVKPAQDFLAFLASPESLEIKQAMGMFA